MPSCKIATSAGKSFDTAHDNRNSLATTLSSFTVPNTYHKIHQILAIAIAVPLHEYILIIETNRYLQPPTQINPSQILIKTQPHVKRERSLTQSCTSLS